MKKLKKLCSVAMVVMGIGMMLTGCGSEASNEEVTAENAKEIVVGTSGSYYPWAFKKDDKLQGFEIDVWNEIASRNGYEIEYQTSKFSGLLGLLNSGKIDTIAHQMSITKEREEKYDFTEPYAYSYYDFAIKSDSTIATLDDLKGKKVGCWLGGNGEKTLRDANEKNELNLDIKTYDGAPIEKEVELGRLDAAWQGEVKMLSTIEQGDLDLKMLGARLAFEVNSYPFLKETADEEVIKSVSETIKEMREDGTLSEISQKWFGLDTTNEPTQK